MQKTLKNHASLRGTNVVSDVDRLSQFHIRTEEWQGRTFNLLSQLSERQLAQSTHVALLTSKRYAFTMAEILLSLTIIGVVAAITLPSLMANINERTWNTQRKALYARMSQAIAMMPQLNGYGEYEGTNTNGVVTATKDTAAEAFLTEGLSKVLKINNICDAAHLADCGVATSFTNLAGSAIIWPTKISELNSVFTDSLDNTANDGIVYTNPQRDIDTKAAAFETQNGETLLLYYNPFCTPDIINDTLTYTQPKMCANFIYDLNGNKGPNTVGKDIGFITALYSSEPVVVAPMPLATNASDSLEQTAASAACTLQDSDSRLPNRDELSSMFYNSLLLGIVRGHFWSSSVVTSGESGTAWYQSFHTGCNAPHTRSYVCRVRCVKR